MSDLNPNGPVPLARLYTDIAFFRRGPEDVPFSRRVFGVTVLAYLLLGLLLGSLMPAASDSRVAVIVLDSVLALAWYWVVLRLARRPERFLQTATAVFGVQTVFEPAAVAVKWLVVQYWKDPNWQAPVALLMFVVALWVLAVNVRILRAATGWAQFACVAAVMAQSLLGFYVLTSLFPGPPGQP